MSHEEAHHVHESPRVMTLPLVALAIATVVAGMALGAPGEHGTAFQRFLGSVLHTEEGAHGLFVPAISSLAAVAGVALAWLMYIRRPFRAQDIGVPRGAIHRLLLRKYYVDEIYDAVLVRPAFRLWEWCAKVFDLGVIDGAVNGVGNTFVTLAAGLRRWQTGLVMNYALSMLVGAVAVVAFLLAVRG
jgi:NADH-quinone oxidoreductase subunit L